MTTKRIPLRSPPDARELECNKCFVRIDDRVEPPDGEPLRSQTPEFVELPGDRHLCSRCRGALQAQPGMQYFLQDGTIITSDGTHVTLALPVPGATSGYDVANVEKAVTAALVKAGVIADSVDAIGAVADELAPTPARRSRRKKR